MLDSLNGLLAKDKDDTVKVNHLSQICFELRNANPARVIEISPDAIKLAEQLGFKKGNIELLNWRGIALSSQGRNDEAKETISKAMQMARDLNYPPLIARTLFSLGYLNNRLGLFNESISYFKESLDLAEKSNCDKKLISNIHNSYGTALKSIGNNREAINQYLSCLKISEQINDKSGLAAANNNLGTLYQNLMQVQEALDCFDKAVKMNLQTGNRNWLANNYANISLAYFSLADYKYLRKQMRNSQLQTEEYINLALKNDSLALVIKKELNDQVTIADIYNNIGLLRMLEARVAQSKGNKKLYKQKLGEALSCFKEIEAGRLKDGAKDNLAKLYNNYGIVYTGLGDYTLARKYLEKCIAISKEIGTKPILRDSYVAIASVDSNEKNYRLAFHHYRLYSLYKDSLINEEDSKKVLELKMNFNFEMTRKADSLKNAEIANTEKIKHESEIRHQKNYTYGGIGGFLLMVIVAFMAIKAYRNKQNANAIISAQKEEVEKKQKEILDSIYYAKRIQDSLLPPPKYIARKLGNVVKKKT